MAKPPIPEELMAELEAKLLESLPEEFRAIAQALRSAEVPPPESEDGLEIEDVVKVVATRMRRELLAFERVFDGDRLQGRILVYTRQTGPKAEWALTQMEYAGNMVLGGGPEQLQSLAEHLLEDEDGHSVAIWLNPIIALGGARLYFLYLRHRSGLEMAYVLREDRLRRLPVTPPQMGSLLTLMTPDVSMDRGYWKRVLSGLAAMATTELRPGFAQYLRDTFQIELDDDAWAQVTKHLYLNVDFVRFQMEIGRSVATPVLQEAQMLLTALVEGLERASAMVDERLDQARRDHGRELRRRVSDYEKLDLAYQGLLRRAQRQAEELARRKQPASIGLEPAGGPAPQSLAQALRQLF